MNIGLRKRRESGEDEKLEGKRIVWHELFHCLTRNNPDFRKAMYSIIHFTVQDNDFQFPPSLSESYISNPDVEHHDSYATFRIKGKDIDCFLALIMLKPDDAENFGEVLGTNTLYGIDPEECMADNFSFLMVDGIDGRDYPSPEIIRAIADYLSSGH